jgi:murein DD-endopeptidase MepM/ murein hydrolase activator NlpD
MDRRLPIDATARPGGRYGAVRISPDDGACPRGFPCVHRGIDLPARLGSFVRSPGPGQVQEVEVANAPPWTGYAPVVLIRTDDGWLHLLAHVTGLVVPGQRVVAGQPVAVVGALRHVHWEVRSRRAASDLADIVLDPRDWLDGYAGQNDSRSQVRTAGQGGVEAQGGGAWLVLLALALSTRR